MADSMDSLYWFDGLSEKAVFVWLWELRRRRTARLEGKIFDFFWNDENGTESAWYDYGKYFECFYRNYGRDATVQASSPHGHGINSNLFIHTEAARRRTFHSYTKTALLPHDWLMYGLNDWLDNQTAYE